jgi:enterochelin esterase-like enzyme/sugar lactone lactonase YvrE
MTICKTAVSPAILLLALVLSRPALAEDWGAYSLVPASAPGMVLEAEESGTTAGTIVSIGKPAGTPNQKWIITAKDKDFVTIRPSYSSTLVLAIDKGGKRNGTQAVLETDKGEPWQQWSIKKTDSGNFNLIPRHAPEKGLDDNGGKKLPGSRQDLFEIHPNDQHLQWMIQPLAGSPLPVAPPQGAASHYVAPELKPEQILKGQVKEFDFNTSQIFPGTDRKGAVFIPAQYDGSKPACVYVKTDGYNPREKELLETLIAGKEIPVTIGIFIRPGQLQPTIKGTNGRRNRCFEYDGVSDNNVRFLLEELLPFVAKQFDLKLSDSGNDRCISGGSSGGIAAFTAAWLRPDAFSRVYAASGSFVAFRGGNEYPTLVRKFEAKPIRCFLTTATHDMENCAGDWYLLDQEMDKAMKFSGYDYIFRPVEGRHVAGYMDNYQEAMAYLWKGWPEPVKAGPSAPRVQDVILPGETWKLIARDVRDARGPASNAKGEVFFVSDAGTQIHRIDAQGQLQPFASSTDRLNSLSFGPQGELYAVSSQSGKIVSYDPAGKATLYAEGIRGRYVQAMPGGGMYVSGEGEKPDESGAVWFVKDGKKTLVDSGMKFSTGIAYRPDQWLLSVADGRSKWAYSYQINPDGSLTNKERFFWLHVPDWEDDAGAESVCYAKEGQMFVATRFGIEVCTDDGPTQVILPLPNNARPIGVCIGGPDRDILFAFTGDSIYQRKIKNHAVGAFDPWVKTMGGKL